MPFLNSETVCEMKRLTFNEADAGLQCDRLAVYCAEWIEPHGLNIVTKRNLCGTHAMVWSQTKDEDREAGRWRKMKGRFRPATGVIDSRKDIVF
jgi:hypothetical protein